LDDFRRALFVDGFLAEALEDFRGAPLPAGFLADFAGFFFMSLPPENAEKSAGIHVSIFLLW
jgi:hypothetical protein